MDRLTFKAGGFNAFSSRGLCTYGGIQNDGSVIHIGSVADKLAEYEDLEEQEKLLKLPCAVGDMVYVIPTRENGLSKITKMKCLGFSISNPTNTFNLYPIDKKNCTVKMYQPDLDDFDKTVFLTEEKAEAVLKKLKRGKGK